MAKKKIDVNRIKTYYIRHNISLEKLAKRYKVSRATINKYKKNDDEDWDKLKKDYSDEIAKKTLEELKEKDKQALVDAQRELDNVLYSAIDVLKEIAKDDKQFKRYSTSPNERMMMGEVEYIGEKVDTKAFMNYIKAVSEINAIIKSKTDINTANDSINVLFEDYNNEYSE